jgi:hypothetical protein
MNSAWEQFVHAWSKLLKDVFVSREAWLLALHTETTVLRFRLAKDLQGPSTAEIWEEESVESTHWYL